MGLKISNANGDTPAVYLYGVIGDEYGGITSDQFRKELAQIPAKQSFNLHIHSDGGSVFEGVAIHSQLSQRKGDVNVIVDGLAASAASFVAMAGKTITMAKHSWMMIHEAHGAMHGRASDFRSAADRLEALNSEIMSIYAGRWKGTPEELRAALDLETWLDADAAVAAGLADGISESMSIAACVSSEMKFKHIPEVLAKAGPSPAHLERLEIAENLIV
jgi:ATP-dependent Clp protease, protease subunit